MKKIIAVILVLLIAITVAGCGERKEYKKIGDTPVLTSANVTETTTETTTEVKIEETTEEPSEPTTRPKSQSGGNRGSQSSQTARPTQAPPQAPVTNEPPTENPEIPSVIVTTTSAAETTVQVNA